MFITKPVYLLSSTKFQFKKMRASGSADVSGQGGGVENGQKFADVRKGERGVKSGHGGGGLGKCGRPPNFGDFPQNSI